MKTPKAARQHFAEIIKLEDQLVRASRRSWKRVNPAFISESWNEQIVQLQPLVESTQQRAAFAGGTYSAMTLADQKIYVAPTEFTNSRAFAGFASDGRPLGALLYSPAITAKQAIGGGASVATALLAGRQALDRISQTIVADASRQAAGVDILARPGTGYTRMVSPGACSRCMILAGRFYRWNDGFLRHPQCNCEHVATAVDSRAEAYANGLIDDPYEAFRAMSESDQDRAFGKAGAQAIRDGADMSQVVNARRGMTANGNFTTAGTRRGYASEILRPGQRRLTPEGIYDLAKRNGYDRDWTLSELRTHGYLLPQGQVPTGAIRGQREGFGQLGAGGQRRAASQAVLDARATGVRDPQNRYTMTAAERRLFDARRDYETALSGVSPYRSSPGFGNTPDPYGLGLNTSSRTLRKVTPEELADAEKTYRAFLESRGNIFTRDNR